MGKKLDKMKNLGNVLKTFFDALHLEHVAAYSSYATLFLIMAFVPFLIILLTFLKLTPLTYDVVINTLKQFFPSSMYNALESIFKEVYSQTSPTILTISTITALWSSGKGAVALTRGLNFIYEVGERRNYILLRLSSSIYAILLMLLVVITIVLNVFGEHLVSYLIVIVPQFTDLFNHLISFKPVYTIVLLAFFFSLMYKFLPNRKCHYLSQLPGAIFSAAGWVLVAGIFSYYIDHFDSFSAMYGSLTTIMITMLWLYTSMNLFFIGGAFNSILSRTHHIRKGIRAQKKRKENNAANPE